MWLIDLTMSLFNIIKTKALAYYEVSITRFTHSQK